MRKRNVEKQGKGAAGGDGGSLTRNGEAAEQKPPAVTEAATAAAAAAAAAPTAAGPDWQPRCKAQLNFVVGIVLLLLPALQTYVAPPQLFWQALLGAGLATLAYRVLVFTRWADELPYVRRFLACFAAMVTELLLENVMVWVVSATDERNRELVPGLQDNGRTSLLALARSSGWLGAFIHGKWYDVKHFLGSILLLAFSNAWDQHPFSSFGMMARFSLTVCISRLLRTACFMSTVLPSPTPGCYLQRFPPPPRSTFGIIWVGVRQLRGFGGCNDLIFSGHGTLWTMAPLMFSTYYPKRFSTKLLWLALLQACIRDIIDKQHYTVDMILAVVVTCAAWGWTRHVYPEDQPLPRPEGAAASKPSALALMLVAAGLATAAVAVFVAKS